MDFKLMAQLFADGGGAGAGSGAGTGTATGDGAAAEGAQIAAAQTNGRKARVNPLANVRYGIQEDDGAEALNAGEQNGAAAEGQQETFEDLIKGRFKADYDARVAATVQDRLKNVKNAEATLQKLKPVLDALGKRYSLDTKDIGKLDVDALAVAMATDDDALQQESLETGLPLDVVKELHQLREGKRIADERERNRVQMDAEQQHFQNLVMQGMQLKQTYPGFDLRTEMQNPDFVKLTRQGMYGVKDAYEFVHRNEIMQGQIARASQQAAVQVANSVAAQASRPAEPGGGGQSGSEIKRDPTKFTREDREEIRRRVMRGEKIKF